MLTRNIVTISGATAVVLLAAHSPWPLWAIWGGLLCRQIATRRGSTAGRAANR